MSEETDQETLILGAGGFSTFYYLGAASIMATKGELEKVTRIVCSGGGVYLGALLACKISPWDIMKVFQRIKKLVPFGFLFHAISKGDHKAWDLFKYLREIFQTFCRKTLGEIPTFQDLTEQGMKLEVVVTNLQTLEPFVLSAESTPELKLDWAIMASLGGPGLMENHQYQGTAFSSGALSCPLPIDADSGPATVFALEMPPFKDGVSLPANLYQLFIVPSEILQRQTLAKHRNRSDLKIYVFRSKTRDFLGMALGPSNQMEMIQEGQQQYGHHLRTIIPLSELKAYEDDRFV